MSGEAAPERSRFPRLDGVFAGMPQCFPRRLEEGYPRILTKVESLWGSRQATTYLKSLLLSDRADRMGFDEAIVAELVLLSQLHARLFPAESRDPNDRWELIEQMFSGELGMPVRLEVLTAKKKIVRRKDLKEKVMADSTIKEVLDLFEGRIVDVMPIKKQSE